jgi:hypothetical protein
VAAHKTPLPVLTLTMNGKTITFAPETMAAGGVRVVSKVSHEPQGAPILVRLNPGVSLKQFIAALPRIGADPNNVDPIGSIRFSPQANRGTSSAQVNLLPGRYVVLDIAPNTPVVNQHVLTITPTSSPAALPKPQATVASIEFAFRSPRRLHNGELVRFANHGFLVHMVVAARGQDLAGARQIARLLRAGKDNKAGRLATNFYSFANALSHGAYQQQVIHNRRGWWVLACFFDTQDGREHTQLGMERVIHIGK